MGKSGIWLVRTASMHGRTQLELPAFMRRLDRQAARTAPLRHPVYASAGLGQADTILDVGSGSGAVTKDLQEWSGATVVALDADRTMALRSREAGMPAGQGDGRALPFRDGCFDAAVCNLTLLWSPEPGAVVAEMARVVRPGGVVVASMEPDYGGKVHHPENPLVDVVFRGEAIRARGGDPHAGRRLREHFVKAGLRTEVGIGNLDVPTTDEDLAHLRRNRRVYRAMLTEAGFGRSQVDGWEEEYRQALEAGIQMNFLPIFFGIGRVRSDEEPDKA